MSHVVVKLNTNWADEMDIEGFIITTEDEWKEYTKEIKKDFPEDCEMYVGTNEHISFSNYEEFMSCLKVTKVNKDEAKLIKKLFGDSYGFGHKIWEIAEIIADNKQEED